MPDSANEILSTPWALLPFIIFGARFLYFFIGELVNLVSPESSSKLTEFKVQTVSVIVPARNEAGRIGEALHSIANASNLLPKGITCQIIAVNDRSEDSTLEEIKQSTKSGDTAIDYIDIKTESEKELPGKPGALQKGIDRASGELVMMTDADCRVSTQWIRSALAIYSVEPKKSNGTLIAAYTLIKHRGPFSKMQGVEWLYTHTMASASNKLGITLGCYGNNLSADRTLLEKTDGFRGVPFSVTEDLAFMQKAKELGANILYPCSAETSVRTEPAANLKEYLSQHHRWAKGGQAIGWKAVAFVFTTIAILAGMIWAILIGNWALAFSFLSFRIALDSILILPAALKLKEYSLIPWIPIALLLLIITEILLPFLLMKKEIKWKGQSFR